MGSETSAENPQAPITPSFDRLDKPTPEPPALPSSTRQPEAQAAPAKAQAKPVPRHKRKLGKRKPKSPAELQSRRDLKLLDAQLRVITLRKFLQSHDLWEVFLAANRWW